MSFIWGPIQMLIASLMFMLTVKRDRVTIQRILIGIGCMCILYILLPIREWAQNFYLWQTIWALFLLLCTAYIHFALRCTWRQAIYCATCALAVQHIFWAVKMLLRMWLPFTRGLLPELIMMILVFIFFYRIFSAHLFMGMFDELEWKDLFSTFVILYFVLGITTLKGLLGEENLRTSTAYLISDALCSFYVLWMNAVKQEQFRLRKERDDLEFIVNQQKYQYEITQNMIDRINQRCHDIKHQIHEAGDHYNNEEMKEYLDQLADHVMVYDMAIRTGNKALDTVLMEKGLLCKEKSIQWICMAEGNMMSFIKPSDIYAIFGNLIDNAIEAVDKLSDPEKRIINVRVASHESLMTIEVENLYEGSIFFNNELPITTKENREDHGFGVKSVDYIVKTYDGTFTITAQDQVFRVKILIPIR